MGTPVIALCSNSHVSRVGHSILSNLGYSNLIAESVDEYIDIAVSLANDKTQLNDLHNTMHDTVAQSCILDHKSHTNELENQLLRIIKQHNSSL